MSTKQEQVLEIDPPVTLEFTGPFHQEVSSFITLMNPSERKVCYKIKTTAPERYGVKPKAGVIDPMQTAQIEVTLQPFDFDPQDKNRDKFMVQSMYAPPGEINPKSILQLWKEAESSQLMDSKLKCLFLPPESNGFEGGDRTSNCSFRSIGSGNGDCVSIKDPQSPLSTQDPPSRPTGQESYTLHAKNPDADSLSTRYLCMGLLVLIIGIIMGYCFFIMGISSSDIANIDGMKFLADIANTDGVKFLVMQIEMFYHRLMAYIGSIDA